MNVVAARLWAIELPLREPFVVAYGRWEAMPAVIVELIDEQGRSGWGEGVPDEIVTAEHLHGTFEILRRLLLPRIVGCRVADIEAVHARMDAVISGNTAAKAAIDLALHDLLGQAGGLPVYDLVGGRSNTELSYPRVVPIGDPAAMAEQAALAVGSGYASVKIKVGQGDPRLDVERVHAVSQAVADRVPIRVDANQGWQRPDVAIRAIRAMSGCGVCWVEEPIRAGDIAGLAEVRRAVEVPIMADETCHGPESLLAIIAARAADLVNIKLMKTGGIHPALAMCQLAHAAGLRVQIGSMVESSLGSAAGYHVATARGGVVSTELTGPLLFSREIGDLRYEPPLVHLSQQPGLGVSVDVEAVAELSVAHAEVGATAAR
ncbi:mandelate racemase/muconate lactonizing enzyme family protein [Gephyromycinifex aptenodytis]|uniref:mandelate racemase/muconate lactonizing enzyme family protein n=1 Tax=Gephyromycinifex aptenodytis TaxID=2716227 RepID=UPI0014479690|nr:dipeptide epimerase [Gephyromycinifex aptenodytis]